MKNWFKDLNKVLLQTYSYYLSLRSRRNFGEVVNNVIGTGHEEFDNNVYKYDEKVAIDSAAYYTTNTQN